jgi:MFS family permease
MIALVQVIVTDMVGLNERGAFVGIAALSWAFGTVFGPIIGCAIAEHTTWRWYPIQIHFLLIGSSILTSQLSLSSPSVSGSSLPFESIQFRSARNSNVSTISASSSLSEAQHHSSSDLRLVESSSVGHQEMLSPPLSLVFSVWFYSGLLKNMLSSNL